MPRAEPSTPRTTLSLLGSVQSAHFPADLGASASEFYSSDQYALVYLTRGAGAYEDGAGRRVELAAGDLLVTFPGVRQRFRPRDDAPPPSGTAAGEPGGPGVLKVEFAGPVFDLWRRRGLIGPAHPPVRLVPVDYWLARLRGAVGEGAALPGDAGALHRVCLFQTVLAAALAARLEPAVDDDPRGWLRRATAAVRDADPCKAVDWHALAARLGTSYGRFRKRFTRLAGVPPARYRLRALVGRACERLRRPDTLVKDVGGELGFRTESHFSRRFKQVTGLSPREFRRRALAGEAPPAGGATRAAGSRAGKPARGPEPAGKRPAAKRPSTKAAPGRRPRGTGR